MHPKRSLIDTAQRAGATLNPTSTLLAYFELNKNDHAARQFTYTQIPSHYVYKQHKENRHKVFRWSERKSQFN